MGFWDRFLGNRFANLPPVVLEKAVYNQGFSEGTVSPPGYGQGNYLLGKEFDEERYNSEVYRHSYEHSPWAATAINAIANVGSKGFHITSATDSTATIAASGIAPILAFLNAPNPTDTFVSLLMKIYQDLMIRGSVFLEFRTTASATGVQNLTPLVQKALAPFQQFIPDVAAEVQDVIGAVASGGIPTYLAVLPAEQMEVVTDKLGNIKKYVQWCPEGGKITFAPNELMRIFHPKSRSRTYGDSPLKPLVTLLTIDALVDKRQKKMLANDVVIDTIFSVPEARDKEEVAAFSEQMMAQYRAAGSSGNFLTTTSEVIVQDISKSKEGDYLGLKQNIRDQILMELGVPISQAGDTSGTSSSYSAGSDNAARAFVSNTILPLAKHIEAALNRQLMPLYSAIGLDDYIIVFDILDDDDTADVEITYDKMIRNGTMTINEVRAKRGQSPVPDGDTSWIDAKAPITLDTLVHPPEPAAPPGTPPIMTPHIPLLRPAQSGEPEVAKAIVEARQALKTLRKAYAAD
jgi:HK97 family phage portal protein